MAVCAENTYLRRGDLDAKWTPEREIEGLDSERTPDGAGFPQRPAPGKGLAQGNSKEETPDERLK